MMVNIYQYNNTYMILIKILHNLSNDCHIYIISMRRSRECDFRKRKLTFHTTTSKACKTFNSKAQRSETNEICISTQWYEL